jgi:hypothetical protein
MTPTDDFRLDASQHAGAIARWEDEGGASKFDPNKGGAERKARLGHFRPKVGSRQENSQATHPIVLVQPDRQQ